MVQAPCRQPTSLEELRTLWIGGLQRWVDEKFLYGCFAHTGVVQSVRLIRNKTTKVSEGYGFIEFISHEAAEEVLRTCNGAQMPGTEHIFRLNWASLRCGTQAVVPYLGKINRYDADQRRPDAGPGQSNGGYFSTSHMGIRAAIPKASSGLQPQNGAAKATYRAATYTIPQAQTVPPDSDFTNTTLSIGNLDPNATEEELRQICVQFGELIDVKILAGKGCGFVQYASRASAEEAVQRLHGTVIGQKVVILSWGRSPANQQVESAAGMASEVGSHVPGSEQNKVYDPVNLPGIHKNANVVMDPNTGRSEGYGFMKFAAENVKTSAVTEMNGAYDSTRPMQIGAAIPKTPSRSQLQDGAAKDILHASESLLVAELPVIAGALLCPVVDPVSPPRHSAELLEIKSGTLQCPVSNLISLPLRIGSVSVNPTVLVETNKKKKKKKRKKRKKRTGSASPRTDSSSATYSSSSVVGSSPSTWGGCLPIWSVPWSRLPCGCPWPLSPLDAALNVQPTQYGLHHPLPDEPNEILASFKPWMQRFHGYGGAIPCPHDLVSLEEFKKKCPLSEPYFLHNCKEIGVTTSSGRFVIEGLVEDIISAFTSGYSWGGDFHKGDFAVQIGVRCYVSKVPTLQGTYNNLCKDLDQLADSLIPYFRGEHSNGIAFIEHLYRTLKNPPCPSSTKKERRQYLKFLKSHPARADPLSTSSLLVGIVQTFKSMGLSDKQAYERALNKMDFKEFLKWIDKVKSDPLWSKVYNVKRQKTKKKRNKERYSCTAISLATFLRHFVIHSPEYTIVGGVQLMKTIDEVDYLIGDFFGDFIADLFRALLEEFDMDKDFLKSVWKLYDVGEDRKDIIKRIWNCEQFSSTSGLPQRSHPSQMMTDQMHGLGGTNATNATSMMGMQQQQQGLYRNMQGSGQSLQQQQGMVGLQNQQNPNFPQQQGMVGLQNQMQQNQNFPRSVWYSFWCFWFVVLLCCTVYGLGSWLL